MPYTGTGALDYVPFDSDGFEELSTLWQLRVPDRCSTSKAWSSQPWVCAMLNFSIATVESEVRCPMCSPVYLVARFRAAARRALSSRSADSVSLSLP